MYRKKCCFTLDKCLLKWFSSLLLLVVCVGLAAPFNEACADESELIELVRKHDGQWKKIKSIQLSYTRDGKFGGIVKPFPGCYWESDGDKSRATVIYLDHFSTDKNGNPVAEEMRRDVFCDGESRHELIIPSSEYPLDKVQLCDLVLRDEKYQAWISFRGTFDTRFYFPIPRYFFPHTETNGLTLLELVTKYPSNVVSSSNNSSGDNIVEIAIESRIDNHESFGHWKTTLLINTSKGYNIEARRSSVQTKEKPPVELIEEVTVKKYAEIDGYWIPCVVEIILHNGEPEKGNKTNFIITDCKINDTSESRLDDFRFPENLIVYGKMSDNQPENIHVWGADNKPARSFDEMTDFLEYYTNECMSGGELPQRDRHLALRITFVVFGLIMIAVALYRLYAKER